MPDTLFYYPEFDKDQKEIVLDEDTSKHIVQVLRMNNGQMILLTDGKGHLASCTIIDNHKKRCKVSVNTYSHYQNETRKVAIAISLIKNSSRFEWFLEKATELGVTAIIPLHCDRTEKQSFRMERMQQICVSAMIQSRQLWLPQLHQPIAYELLFRQQDMMEFQHKLIAHCAESQKKSIMDFAMKPESALLLIGPEGDFTSQELQTAFRHQFEPVTLGSNRLRTETAGIAGAAWLSSPKAGE